METPTQVAVTEPDAEGRDCSKALHLGPWAHVDVLQELGRLGGRARTRNLTAARRRELARKAAKARWGKKPRLTKKGRQS